MLRTAAAFLLPMVLLAALAGQSRALVPAKQLTVADIVSRSSAAVVQIVVSDSTGKEIALGSGFLISADGMIVTNYHVIKNASSAIAKLANGAFFPVEGVMNADADKDLAILKVNGKDLPFLKLALANRVSVGDHVLAIGSPLGFEGTVSDGIVSALRTETLGKNWIQTTAPVSHGNSGGPLLNMDGSVIGVITWGVDQQQGENLNFAIPAETVETLIVSTYAPVSFDAFRNSGIKNVDNASDKNPAFSDERMDALVMEGHKLLAEKEYERAIHDFEEAIRIRSENAAAWNGLGWAHSSLNQHEEAVTDLRQALKYAPEWEECWISLGVEYLILSKPSDALVALQRAVGIKATDARAWLYLGKTYVILHSDEQATRCFKQATSIEPTNAEAWYELGTVSIGDDSIGALTKALELKPDYADAWHSLASSLNNVASSLNNAKRYEDAIVVWKKVLELKPMDTYLTDTRARVWWRIGGAYENLNELENATQAYLKALHLEQALPYHTDDDNNLIGYIFEALYLTYSKMGKHRESEKYRENFVWWEQNKPK